MYKLAQLHLSSSAASVPVECMFSTAGLVANGKRSNLSVEKLHCLCFVHHKYSCFSDCEINIDCIITTVMSLMCVIITLHS